MCDCAGGVAVLVDGVEYPAERVINWRRGTVDDLLVLLEPCGRKYRVLRFTGTIINQRILYPLDGGGYAETDGHASEVVIVSANGARSVYRHQL